MYIRGFKSDYVIVSLRTQLAHAVFANDVRRGNAKMFGDELMQFRLWQRSRASLVAAGFQNARSCGETIANVVGGKVIQQMNKRKGCSKNRDGTVRAHGFAQAEKRLLDVQSPGIGRVNFPAEDRVARTQIVADGFKHVNE